MELKDFISEALTQIVEGIETTQDNLKEKNRAKVNPAIGAITTDGKNNVFGFEDGPNQKGPIFLIDFNVLVEAKEGSEGKKGIGVVSGIIGIGGQKKQEHSNTYQTSISFKIPLKYPTT